MVEIQKDEEFAKVVKGEVRGPGAANTLDCNERVGLRTLVPMLLVLCTAKGLTL